MTTPNLARFVDIHALQTVPYANLNRDDLGAPKSVVYGGSERTRVSSQSWKRAVRLELETRLGDPAVRTRRLISAVTAELTGRGWDPDLAAAAGRQVVLSAGKNGIKTEKKQPSLTSVLLYLPASGITALADLAAQHRDAIAAEAANKDPKPVLPADQVADILRSRNATIRLMGRMLAELPGGDVDGAVMFAHAFTTHATTSEVDFFTAVDDIPDPSTAGSGHMNDAEFSSGVFYRYASVATTALHANLDGDTSTAAELLTEFLRAFTVAIPSGKQNSTAALTIPELVYIAVRSDRPISLAPAFEAPVCSEIGYAAPSRDALSAYAASLHDYWGSDGILHHGYACINGKPAAGLGDRAPSLSELITAAAYAACQP